MQLRFETDFTSNEYVKHQAWQDATLERCPLHPAGGCSFARHGTYERVKPPGTRIPRWYCPEGRCTFSLLADCFAARLTGSLQEVEEVVVAVEQAKSREAAADDLRADIELPGALRWIRRRFKPVQVALTVLLGLFPDLLMGCQPTVSAFRQWFGVDFVLPLLREIAEAQLPGLPPPLGFRPPLPPGGEPKKGHQHQVGPDPPGLLSWPRDHHQSIVIRGAQADERCRYRPWPCGGAVSLRPDRRSGAPGARLQGAVRPH